jgi:hypothetical protein
MTATHDEIWRMEVLLLTNTAVPFLLPVHLFLCLVYLAISGEHNAQGSC